MKEENNFVQKSYEVHEFFFKETFNEKKMYSWTRDNTVDTWKHRRMGSCLDPILDSYSESKWLTVGDGKYGTDAHYIESKNIEVLATDISDYYLKIAKKNNFIKILLIRKI